MLMNGKTKNAIAALAVLSTVNGCASIGIRPNPKQFSADQTSCTRFQEMYNYTLDLREAYHSRASQNRWWIYAAGTLALGTTAATAGLGAAGAAGLSIALLGVSGGFSSGFFALLNNSTLADVYTISANQLSKGLTEAEAELHYQGPPGGATQNIAKLDQSSCASALGVLEQQLTKAETDLETARSNSAAAALIRAQDEMKKIESAALKDALKGARIDSAKWTDEKNLEAKVIVSGADMEKVPLSSFKVNVGDATADPASLRREDNGTYSITFTAPKEPDDTPDKGRPVSLVFQSAGITVTGVPTIYLEKEKAA